MTDPQAEAQAKAHAEAHAAAHASRPPRPAWIVPLMAGLFVTVFAVLLTISAVQHLGGFITMVVISLFLSFALEPAVQWLARHGWPRGLAAFAALIFLIVFAVGAVVLMAPLFISQARMLIDHVPDWLARISKYSNDWLHVDLSTQHVTESLREASAKLLNYKGDIVGKLFGFGSAVVGAVFKAMTIGLFTFYLLADGPRLRRVLLSYMPEQRQRHFLWGWETAVDKVGGYLYSRALLAALSAAFGYAALKIIGVDYALPLALFMGVVSQFIPTIGTYIGAALPLAVALLISPSRALVFLIYVLVYQQLENYLFAPRVTAHTMELHAGIAFGSVIVGASLFGAIGGFLALPVTAVIQAGIETFVQRHDVVESELTKVMPPPVKKEKGKPLMHRLAVRLRGGGSGA
jgi:predicted PurR-regulated permease PerM